MAVALEHHRARRLPEAQKIYRQVLAAEPNNFDALHLLGVAAHQSGDHAQALEFIDQALRQNPVSAAALNNAGDVRRALDDLDGAGAFFKKALSVQGDYFEALNNLGTVLQAQNLPDEAVPYFERAVALRPELPVVQYNLGRVLKQSGELPAATRAFFRAWGNDSMFFAAAEQFVATAAAIARKVAPATWPSKLGSISEPLPTSIIMCSIDETKRALAVALYERLYRGRPHEIIVIRDARSLAEAYNRGIAASAGEIVVLSHDDIDILAPDFAVRLQGHLERQDIVGVMGSTEMTGPAWGWSGHPHLRGWITHYAPSTNEWSVDIADYRQVSTNIAVLDGVFLAAKRDVFDAIAFDSDTFDGFHLYDIDWSYRAAMAGFKVAVTGDLLLVHASRGSFDPAWERYAERFCAKHGVGQSGPAPHRQVFEATLHDSDQVRAFFDQLIGLEPTMLERSLRESRSHQSTQT